MLKGAIIGGVVVLIFSALFIWDALGQYLASSAGGESPNVDEFKTPLILGGLGVFAGIILIFIGFNPRFK